MRDPEGRTEGIEPSDETLEQVRPPPIVGIEERDEIRPAGEIDPAVPRPGLPAPTAHLEADTWIAPDQPLRHVTGPIGAAVLDDRDGVRRQGLCEDRLHGLRKESLGISGRDDDSDARDDPAPPRP